MISKNEKVMDYIAGLEAGEKVSVRKLARELGVSEGTAYKSIKQAEAQGLVITKPKVGTLRVNIRGAGDEGEATLAEAARSIGAVCLCGAERAAEMEMPCMVLGDGSEKQFQDAVHRAGGSVMCVLGARPELHRMAVELGCHIMLTGGCLLSEELMRRAEELELCVFASEQDSSTLLGMLNRRLPSGLSTRDMSTVRDWMQLPRYLYHDDMVMEWYRLYSDIFYKGSSCAVVDDSLKVCGSVEAQTAMNAAPALRLSEIMDPPEGDGCVSEEMGMDELAELFVKGSRLFASVNSADGMSGFISIIDLVRYYLYNSNYSHFDSNGENRLELIGDEAESDRRMFTLQLKDTSREMNRSGYLNSVYTAAAWHAYLLLGDAVEYESGSINCLEPLTKGGEYLISSSLLRRRGNEVLLELELFNDRASYAKASLKYRAAQ